MPLSTRLVAGQLLRGVLGGAVGTLAMSAAMYAFAKVGLLGEPPPRKITAAFARALGFRPRGRTLDAASIAAHLGFGVGAGALYGLTRPRRTGPLRAAGLGSAYGATVWTLSYKGWVPSLGILPAPRRDRPGRPTAMLLAHLVYGVTLAELVNTLAPVRSRLRALPPGAQALQSPRAQ